MMFSNTLQSVFTHIFETCVMFRMIIRYLSLGILSGVLLAGCGSSSEETDTAGSSTPTLIISAAPQSVAYDGSTELTWTSSHVNQCVASGDWTGGRATNGSITLSNLTSDALFTITCTTDSGEISKSVSVTVAPLASAPELTFSASSSQVSVNAPVELNWNSRNTDSCVASGDWSGSKDLSGTETISAVTNNSQFVLQCEGPAGTITRSLSVTVDGTTLNPPSLSFSATQVSLDYDGSTTLQWSVSDADSCSASGDWSGSKPLSGSEQINNLLADSSYTLTCTGSGGVVSDSIFVSVGDPPAPQLTLSASQQTVDYDGSVTLQWSATNADSCSASGAWSGTKVVSGSETVSGLQSDSVFSLRCTGVGGAVTNSVTVSVNDPVPVPALSFTATSLIVDYNGSTTLQWTATDADSCTASGDWSGTRSTSGSEERANLLADSSFSLSCTGVGGTVTSSVDISVNATSSGTATLTWLPPDQNADGSTLNDLAGYRIYYGTSSGSYTETITINNIGTTSYVVENLTPGEWFFVMTAFNTNNKESVVSVERSKVITP
jgi:hypothetical protein